MTLALDGYDILRRIGASPEAFSGLRATVAEVAESLIRAQLTSKTLDLDIFRALASALGDDTLSLVLQTLTSDELHALWARLDPHAAKRGRRDAARIEAHLLDLAHQRCDPAPSGGGEPRKEQKTARARSRSGRKAANPLGTGSMGAEKKGARET